MLYRLLQLLLAPALLIVFAMRLNKGKEHPTRYPERFGHQSKQHKIPRPIGNLVHLHAASVGEALSLLPLINNLMHHTHILLTTGTVTSANLLAKRLPKSENYKIIHQFIPLDTFPTVRAFFNYWHPQLSVFTESDFWPELLAQAPNPMLINARISATSFPKYRRARGLFAPLIARFSHILAQQETDAQRLIALGANPHTISVAGNLKFDAAPLPINPDALKILTQQTRHKGLPRPTLLYASTHNGEEAIAQTLHQNLLENIPNLLTIIAPRHPHRGDAITHQLRLTHRTAQRSKQEAITPDTHFYMADTLGELGTLYALTASSGGVVIMGGSLIPHGGQNPLEPLRLGAHTTSGPHMHNFTDMLSHLTPHFTPQPNPQALQEYLQTTLQSPKTNLKTTAQIKTETQARQTFTQALHGPTPKATKLILAQL